MDTSKEYIKMCEKAAEIQEPKKILYLGDFYIDLNHPEEEVKILDISGLTTTPDDIWLPRQDQLQEMVEIISFDLEGQFHNWFSEIGCKVEWSWEQHWLAFVMYKKFHKEWNGEDWIVIK